MENQPVTHAIAATFLALGEPMGEHVLQKDRETPTRPDRRWFLLALIADAPTDCERVLVDHLTGMLGQLAVVI